MCRKIVSKIVDDDSISKRIFAKNRYSRFCLQAPIIVGYEPADLTVHPPPELPRVGSFFSYRCLVFPKKCPQRKACAFRNY